MPALVEAALPAGGGAGEQIARQIQAAGARLAEGRDRAGQQLLQGALSAAEEDVQMAGLRDALAEGVPVRIAVALDDGDRVDMSCPGR